MQNFAGLLYHFFFRPRLGSTDYTVCSNCKTSARFKYTRTIHSTSFHCTLSNCNKKCQLENIPLSQQRNNLSVLLCTVLKKYIIVVSVKDSELKISGESTSLILHSSATPCSKIPTVTCQQRASCRERVQFCCARLLSLKRLLLLRLSSRG